EGIEYEIARVKRAIKISREQLDEIRKNVLERIGEAEAEIFVAHKMILEDPELIRSVSTMIERDSVNAEKAVSSVLASYEEKILAIDDEYIRERASDFGEIKRRMLDVMGNINVSLQCDKGHCQKGKNRVVVAHELTPSLTVDLDSEFTMGFITEHGGVNSHAAILARAMGIPAVSGLHGIRKFLGCGTEVIVNGDTGEVIINPTEKTKASLVSEEKLKKEEKVPVDPVEGYAVMANISFPDEIADALAEKSEGIGLYRTEFEVMAAGRFFSEDELVEKYLSVASRMSGRMVAFRLFDIGSDKNLPFMEIPEEENPSLGWRGTRLLLGKMDLFNTQARALARVSEGGRVHVMYPMIIDVDQFIKVRDAFMNAVKDIPYGVIKHGIMFEVPSACLVAKELFEVVDFASIGSNDLTQYLFAVDRENDLVSADYDCDKPVFWNLVRSMAAAANE
ncbi:phosphoenolpyruvate--protein phosphotransferase, partial [bacterium B17]